VGDRHDSLIPLSDQPQHALALAVVIRRRFGIEKGESIWGVAMVEIIQQAYTAELIDHFEAEETVRFPEMERHLGKLALVGELLRDHASLRALVQLLETSQALPLLDGFAALLETHVRKEERHFFLEYEKRMPADEARRVGEEIKVRLAKLCPGF